MIGIDVDVSSLREKTKITRGIFDKINRDIAALAEYFHKEIRRSTPRNTGKTAESWVVHYYVSDGCITWEISPDGREDIVTFLEFGTKPHMILPKEEGGVLRFEVDGEVIYAKSVAHPGTKPLGFVRMVQGDIDESCRRLGDGLVAEVSKVWV